MDSANPGDTGWAFANALLGNYDTFTQQSRFIVSHYKYRNYEWYVQDSWKLRPNLTVNVGLRMALLPPWIETNDNLASLPAVSVGSQRFGTGRAVSAVLRERSCLLCRTPLRGTR